MEVSRFSVLVATVAMLLAAVEARGAGRAFPLMSENYVINAFQRINANTEWDESNLLVDLSGQFAVCSRIGTSGFVPVKSVTAEGSSISAYVDDTYGSAADVNAVNSYIQRVIDSWTSDSFSTLYKQIQQAERFGCSVRPACGDRVVVACLFAPAHLGPDDSGTEGGKQNALAFTPAQYIVAEKNLGVKWMRDHYLENLSGYETSCAMLTEKQWAFANAKTKADKRGMLVEGLYGVARNFGETEPAMIRILQSMKKMQASKVGCSIIPDCKIGQTEMWVVVSCLFDM